MDTYDLQPVATVSEKGMTMKKHSRKTGVRPAQSRGRFLAAGVILLAVFGLGGCTTTAVRGAMTVGAEIGGLDGIVTTPERPVSR
jgi:hypothetical protein